MLTTKANRLLSFGLALIFSLIYFGFSVIKHYSFNSTAFDLGTHTQRVLKYGQGKMYCSLFDNNGFAAHFEPILVPIGILYNIFPDPVFLLLIQATFVGLSGIFVFKSCQKHLNDYISIGLTTTYFSSVGVLNAINFDFHSETIAVLPITIVIYALLHEKWRLLLASSIITLLFKENLPLFISLVGIWLVTTQKNIKVGIVLTSISTLYFFLVQFIVMPYLSLPNKYIHGNYFIEKLGQVENTSLLFHEYKIQTIIILYGQYLFMPLTTIFALFFTAPYLLIRFLSNYPASWTIYFHYNVLLEPFLTVGSSLTLGRIVKVRPIDPRVIALFLSLWAILLILLSPVTNISKYYTQLYERAHIWEGIRSIEQNEIVCAQSPLVPHLINRETIYQFPDCKDASVIIVNETLFTYPLTKEELTKKIDNLKSNHEWTMVYSNNSTVIFKKYGNNTDSSI